MSWSKARNMFIITTVMIVRTKGLGMDAKGCLVTQTVSHFPLRGANNLTSRSRLCSKMRNFVGESKISGFPAHTLVYNRPAGLPVRIKYLLLQHLLDAITGGAPDDPSTWWCASDNASDSRGAFNAPTRLRRRLGARDTVGLFWSDSIVAALGEVRRGVDARGGCGGALQRRGARGGGDWRVSGCKRRSASFKAPYVLVVMYYTSAFTMRCNTSGEPFTRQMSGLHNLY